MILFYSVNESVRNNTYSPVFQSVTLNAYIIREEIKELDSQFIIKHFQISLIGYFTLFSYIFKTGAPRVFCNSAPFHMFS